VNKSRLWISFEARWDCRRAATRGPRIPLPPNKILAVVALIAISWLARLPPGELLRLLVP
jgi:hypothetical protein